MLTDSDSEKRTSFRKNRWIQVCILAFAAVWISTFIGTTDLSNWLLENTLVFLFIPFLVFTFRKYQYSDISYLLITLFLCLHVYGAKYTYAENPFGYWLQSKLHWQRNHYDRIVHFSSGFLLAYAWRETFIRWLKFPSRSGWAIPIVMTLSISGIYELIEWAVADIFFKAQGPAYLGTQNDVWDSQKDVALALLGAVTATMLITLLTRAFRRN